MNTNGIPVLCPIGQCLRMFTPIETIIIIMMPPQAVVRSPLGTHLTELILFLTVIMVLTVIMSIIYLVAHYYTFFSGDM